MYDSAQGVEFPIRSLRGCPPDGIYQSEPAGRDGAIRVTFTPMLTPDQYNDLALAAMTGTLRSRQGFCDAFSLLAAQWGVVFTSDFEAD